MHVRSLGALALAGAILTLGCSEKVSAPDGPAEVELAPVSAETSGNGSRAEFVGQPGAENAALVALMEAANAHLAEEGADLRVSHAEWVGPVGGDAAGQTVFADDRGNKQLGAHFVPGDPRRGGRTNATYLVDLSDGATSSGLTPAQTEGAIDRAMTTWDEAPRCSAALDVAKVADPGVDPDIVDGLLGFGEFGVPLLADVVHAGWLPAGALGPNTLGVTFTLVFTSGGGPTDIDGNGKDDVALREIYYNDAFAWGIDAGAFPVTDVETVALHEAGHGLSQAHFGRIFVTESNGKAHFAPFAVMNALISRQAHELEGTDNAGHCSIWGSWPEN